MFHRLSLRFVFILALLAIGAVTPWSPAAWAADATGEPANEAAVENTTMNIRVSPLSLLVGVLSVDADFGIGSSTTLGPSVSLFNRSYNGATYSGGALGVRANFYLGHNKFTDSWIISPYIDLLGLKVNEAPYNAVQLNGSLLGVAIAYQWFWPSGFNLDVGGTFGTYSISNTFNLNDNSGDTLTVSSPYTGGFIGIEFTVGWAF